MGSHATVSNRFIKMQARSMDDFSNALRSTTLPISSVIIRLAYRQMQRKKSAMTSTTFLPTGSGGSHGSGTPERSDSGERRSLNHSHLQEAQKHQPSLTAKEHIACTRSCEKR